MVMMAVCGYVNVWIYFMDMLDYVILVLDMTERRMTDELISWGDHPE